MTLRVFSKKTADKIEIRPATPLDAADAARLIFMTGVGIFKYLFYSKIEKTQAILGRLFEMTANDFTHECAHLTEVDGQIAGLIHFVDRAVMQKNYKGTGKALIKAMGLFPTLIRLRRFIEFESLFPDPDEKTLYINHLATFEEFRGRGIANKLLRFCEQEASNRNLTKLALDVEVDNRFAIRVYEKHDFRNILKTESEKFKSAFGFNGAYRMVKSF